MPLDVKLTFEVEARKPCLNENNFTRVFFKEMTPDFMDTHGDQKPSSHAYRSMTGLGLTRGAKAISPPGRCCRS